jgi:hypothetical protein
MVDTSNESGRIQQAALRLRTAADALLEKQIAVSGLNLTPTQREALVYLSAQVRTRAGAAGGLPEIERNDREFETRRWLDANRFQESWSLAPVLVSMDYRIEALAAIAEGFGDGKLIAVLEWLAATFELHDTVAEVQSASAEIGADE